MMQPGWQVKVTPAEIVSPAGVVPGWAVGWESCAGVAPGTPFLLSPSFEYDTRLNVFFQSGRLRSLAPRTQRALLQRDDTRAIYADLYDPSAIRAHEDASLLNWDKPIGLLHRQAWLRSPADAAAIADSMKRFVGELPAGSTPPTVTSNFPARHR